MFRFAWPLALALTAVGLSGCLTPRVKPTPSQAVLAARAHRTPPPAAVCVPLASPLSVGFGFGESTLGDLAGPALQSAAQALSCHPEASAVVVGQADAHGTDADRRRLAQARADAVAAHLTAHGVAQARLQTQAEGTAPTGDAQHLVVLAEGRRW